ncbi:hypothetical protein FVEG_10993 [Fusarium verticillioides 7600]|uniref:Uncharacterized protein n=1 Tax=Gibberella moniliformis (strain M3125 / FGSC 7600) TaxID=334819 RepID=W7ML59_GIBM7|nr:hypothetical protein FVEG_10993 [Fusarium verticillioides 7600]EWG52198.1 hypothetical protein FVEG_10993 [Fusarium verticillioides 7600]
MPSPFSSQTLLQVRISYRHAFVDSSDYQDRASAMKYGIAED